MRYSYCASKTGERRSYSGVWYVVDSQGMTVSHVDGPTTFVPGVVATCTDEAHAASVVDALNAASS